MGCTDGQCPQETDGRILKESKQLIMRKNQEGEEPRSVSCYVDTLCGHARWTCLRGHCYLDMSTWTNLGRCVADYVHPLKKKQDRRNRRNRNSVSTSLSLRRHVSLSCNSGRKPKKGLRESFQVSGRSTKRKEVLYPGSVCRKEPLRIVHDR